MDKLEDGSITNHSESKSLHSIAISLKRIADALEKLSEPSPVMKALDKLRDSCNG